MTGSPKYLVKPQNETGDPSELPEGETFTRWGLFIKSRKGEGIQQAEELGRFLKSKETEIDWQWISLPDIERHMRESCGISHNRLLQLISDMEKLYLIRKKTVIDSSLRTPNKERTFYKFFLMAETSAKTFDDYKREFQELYIENLDLKRKLDSAMNVLNKHHLLQDYFNDYLGERPRPDYPKEALDADAAAYLSSLDPKARKLMEHLIQKGYGKNAYEVGRRAFEEFARDYKKDPKALSFHMIVRK